MPKKLCIVDGTHGLEIEYVYVERVTDVAPNEPVVEKGVVIGYRVRVSVSFERKAKDDTLLGSGLVRSAWGVVSPTQRSVPEALKAAAEVGVALAAKMKKEWANFPPDKEKIA